jgi:hypothetical protein
MTAEGTEGAPTCLLRANFLVICFGNKVAIACGPGDWFHRDRRGREAKDAKDLGRPERGLLCQEGHLGHSPYARSRC